MWKGIVFSLRVLEYLTIVAIVSNGWTMPVYRVHPRVHSQHSPLYLAQVSPDNGVPYKGPESTPLLDAVNCPSDLKSLSMRQLKQLCHELRWETINSVSKVGGHLGSSLGVVELTVALHYAFNAPEDKIVWDVAHQAYPHKIITGRRQRMGTLRQLHGLSGFTKRSESEYDCFGAGHSSTSISAALGMSVGKRMMNRPTNNCIAVIGDGAITGGMAYEAMNNAAYINSKVVVILNDNEQVSLPTGQPSAGGVVPAGALSGYTSRILTSSTFKSFRDIAKGLNSFMPEDIQNINRRVDEYVRGMATGGTLFEELGFYYVGPVDAHDLDTLVPILENIRDKAPADKPILLHVKSVKGKGYAPAEAAPDRYHGVAKFDVATGLQMKSAQKTASFTDTFAQALINLAEKDRSVCAITAAMPGGTGLDKFGRRFPKRCFDVGIAEQHAVTFAAGLAVEGAKPFVAVYSTFMQRALDQLIHDVALQQLPVRFVLDRAGLVGNDGATHHGTFDLSYIGSVPGIVVMAPSDEVELQSMVETQYAIDTGPSVVRFPRGSGYGEQVLRDTYAEAPQQHQEAVRLAYPSNGALTAARGTAQEVGKGRVIKPHSNVNKKHQIALLSIGTRLVECVKAARSLESLYGDVSVTVADARFLKPLDEVLVRELAQQNDILITVEENSMGGFGAHVLHFLSAAGLLDGGAVKVRTMHIPDAWIEAGTQREQYDIAQLNEQHIVAKAAEVLQSLLELSPRRLIGSSLVEDTPAPWPPRAIEFGASSGEKAAGPDKLCESVFFTRFGGSGSGDGESGNAVVEVDEVDEVKVLVEAERGAAEAEKKAEQPGGSAHRVWALHESVPSDCDGSAGLHSGWTGDVNGHEGDMNAASPEVAAKAQPGPPLRQVLLHFSCGDAASENASVGDDAVPGLQGIPRMHADAEDVCDVILEAPAFFVTSRLEGNRTGDEAQATSQVLSASAEVVLEKQRFNSSDSANAVITEGQLHAWERLVGTHNWASAKVTLTVSADFDTAVLQRLLGEHFPGVTFSISESALDSSKDWVLEVQQGWPRAQVIGSLTVYLPWHNRSVEMPQPQSSPQRLREQEDQQGAEQPMEQPMAQAMELLIEGGAAFGTGDHATTRLCGEWLQRRVMQTVRGGRTDISVLDYGCGSAILALCALKCGAATAAGVDIDEDALASARRNCQLNGLQVDLCHALDTAAQDPAQDPPKYTSPSPGTLPGTSRDAAQAFPPASTALRERQFDLVVANILAPVLIQLAEDLAQLTAPGGSIALSGVLDFQAHTVAGAYATHFEQVCVAEQRDGWVLITGVRPQGDRAATSIGESGT